MMHDTYNIKYHGQYPNIRILKLKQRNSIPEDGVHANLVNELCRTQSRLKECNFEKCNRCDRPVDGVRVSSMVVHCMVLLGSEGEHCHSYP